MNPANLDPRKEISRRSRRGFVGLAAGAAASYAGWRWLWSGAEDDSLPPAFRRVLNANARLTQTAFFNDQHLSPEFPLSAVEPIRANGHAGLDQDLDAAAWRLNLTPHGASQATQLTIDRIKALPKVEMVTEFKCIEGWSAIVHWGGARFRDFVARYAAGSEAAAFAALATPDGEYYVSMDMPSALHPQTLLCYEMNGDPLSEDHGAPLRLVTPVKYGVKNIKRIGTIAFSNQRPRDYWAEQGYDYYAGL